MTTKLSVVLITKNQAWNIARLIESVLGETAKLPFLETQIVLVDSASTDETVEVASAYPIDILRLRPDQRLTPAAGRYVGYKHTTGDLVLFMDGDMELYQGWLERALRVIEGSPDVGAVVGQLIFVPVAATPEDKRVPDAASMDGITEVRFAAGGGAVYRWSVLEQVGAFNPYLCSEEEPELCLRVRSASYRILQLDYPVGFHYGTPSWAISTLVARWRRNLFIGYGQIIRYHLGDGLLWAYMRERGYGCAPALALLVGAITFWQSARARRWILFRVWLLLLVTVIAGDAYRKGGLYKTIRSLLERIFIMDGMVRGFLMKPAEPESYPNNFDIVKQAK